MESEIYYFEKHEPENTDILLELVKKSALEKDIRHVVVATTSGETGVKAAELFKGTGINVVAVTHQMRTARPELLEENERRIRSAGAKIVTCTHAFLGVASSLRRIPPTQPGQQRPEPYWPSFVPATGDLIAQVLRLFSQGMKVCLEITVMATDAGAIPIGANVIAVAGQGRGANTAVVIKSAITTDFFDLDVQEIIAKPIQKRLPAK